MFFSRIDLIGNRSYSEQVKQTEVLMKTILQIEGMSCDHCVKHVKEALEAVGGVKNAVVNLSEKTAEIEHYEIVGTAALIAAVTEAGYEAQ